ncbi:MAG: FecR domain-containing protein [Deltaproteobacteria bacterium]|nr:FecR domain-containing protein [Deltaproteobacteria bacterium]
MSGCAEFREWLKTAGLRGQWPSEVGEHLQSCAGCRTLLSAYRTLVEVTRESTDVRARRPDMDAIRRGLRGSRPRSVARWAVPIAAAAALAAGVWYVSGSASGPGTGAAGTVASSAVPDGAPVRSGQRIETADSPVTVSDPLVGTLRLEPYTRVQVAAWAPGATAVVLESGAVEAEVRHVGHNGAFEVRSPFATVRAIGTRFAVGHRAGLRTDISVSEGVVAVETLKGVEVARVSAGESVQVTATAVIGPSVGPVAAVQPDAASGVGPDAVAPVAVAPAEAGSGAVSPAIVPPAKPFGERSVAVAVVAPAPAGAPSAPLPTPEEVVARGRRMLAEGRHAEVVAMVNQLLGGGAQRGWRVLGLLGDAYRVGGDAARARAAYEEALRTPGAGEGVLADLAGLLERDLGLADEAAGAWKRYLLDYPTGAAAGRAFWSLALRAEAAGKAGEAEDWLRRAVAEAPRSPEAARAVARLGRILIRQGRLDEALTWFEPHRRSRSPEAAEAALVGTMRVRAQQGRDSDVRALAAEHAERFPDGTRKTEVRYLLTGDGPEGNR